MFKSEKCLATSEEFILSQRCEWPAFLHSKVIIYFLLRSNFKRTKRNDDRVIKLIPLRHLNSCFVKEPISILKEILMTFAGFWGLFRLVLLRADDRGRTDFSTDLRLHRHHHQKGKEKYSKPEYEMQ